MIESQEHKIREDVINLVNDFLDRKPLSDQITEITALINKYTSERTGEKLISYTDVLNITGSSVSIFVDSNLNKPISDRKNIPNLEEKRVICIIQSVLNLLENNNCLSKTVKIDFKE